MTYDEGHIRPATLDDLNEVLALWSHYIRARRRNPAYRLTKNGLERRRELFQRHIESDDAVIFVVERQDGGLDGMVTCFTQEGEPYFLPPRYCRIQTPYVRPDARQRGWLRRLLQTAFKWARENELTEVRLYTSSEDQLGNALAEDMGFSAIELVRRKKLDWGAPPEQQVGE